jgi:hypothetical protein
MGNQQIQPSNTDSPSGVKNPGYTSFSISKDQSNPTTPSDPLRPLDMPTPSPNLTVPPIDEIVTVVKQEKEVERDEILDSLSKLPKFVPILRPSENSLLNLFKVEDKSHLEKLDEQLIVDMLSQFQTEMIQKTAQLSQRQMVLIKKFNGCNIQTVQTLQKVQDKHVTLQNISHSLRESDKINRLIERSARDIEAIFTQCKELEELLPHDVVATLDSPLMHNLKPEI